MLQRITIKEVKTRSGNYYKELLLTYEIFGQPLHQAPVVLINHALTGNSTVCGENGWWNGLIGKNKCIDTEVYTIISFNIPGNGYDGIEEHLFSNYKTFVARDIAAVFVKGLAVLEVKKLFAAIGGSVGGGIAWEMAALKPNLIQHLIPVATDWKSTDWLKANCLVQEQILLNSNNPLHDARLHAMLVYRSPASFKQKFNRTYNHDKGVYNAESWLLHHGKKLKDRFSLAAYKMMNYILANIDITQDRGTLEEAVLGITSEIHLISVNSDMFFTETEDKETYTRLKKATKNVTHSVINSIHGHDAFLIEFEQMNNILKPIFYSENRSKTL